MSQYVICMAHAFWMETVFITVTNTLKFASTMDQTETQTDSLVRHKCVRDTLSDEVASRLAAHCSPVISNLI